MSDDQNEGAGTRRRGRRRLLAPERGHDPARPHAPHEHAPHERVETAELVELLPEAEQPSELAAQAPTTAGAPQGVPRRSRRRGAVTSPAPSPRASAAETGPRVVEGGELPPSPRRRLRLVLYWLLGSVLAVALGGALALHLAIEHFGRDLPSVEKLRAGYDPPQVSRFSARDGTLLASVFTERRTVVAFDTIPSAAKLAFLAAEDASFYEHEGLDYLGMLRAMHANIRAGKTVQGGSTITQQVVKNVLLDASRSYQRKIRETLLARRLEQSLTKHEIFWLYLNHIYLGHGRYGIEEAARYYFGKRASQLELDEAAVLAGLVAAPERLSPRKSPEKSLARRRFVLDQMLKKGFVTPELHAAASSRPLRLAPAEESESRLAPEIVQYTTTQLKRERADAALKGGHALQTSIDPGLQAAARAAVRDNLDAYMERHGITAPFNEDKHALWGEPFTGNPASNGIYTGVVEKTDDRAGTIDVRVGDTLGQLTLSTEARYNPKQLAPSAFTRPGAVLRVSVSSQGEEGGPASLRLALGPQSALVAIDIRTREVVALVGGYEAIPGGLDRATQMRRQPGSTFKPIVYSYALHARRFAPATMIPVAKKGPSVLEVDGEFVISVRQALAQSNNEASTLLLRESGAEQVVQWAKALGIGSRLGPDLSLALGSYEVTPLELANAYATLASGGTFAEPVTLVGLTGPDGQAKPLPPRPAPRRVLSEDEAYLITSLMRSVIQGGTGSAAQRLGRPIAGKTGTTNEVKDAWFAGYSTDYVAVLWVGYDDARPLGKKESGARTALPGWIQFMEAAHRGRPATEFTRPPGILQLLVDANTGLLPNSAEGSTVREEFLSGTEPTEVAPLLDAGAPSEAPSASDSSVVEGEREPEGEELPTEEPPPF